MRECLIQILVGVSFFININLVYAQSWDFTLLKHTSGQPGPTLLVIGGIQGDEPGGFNAASLLATQYNITRGEVWVVPNLNFESIIKRSRGVYGDMNRKFKDINDSDPEYQTVQKIKSIIKDPQVDIILNLHDGSGFYHPDYVDAERNPERWGQSLIIDQEAVEGIAFGALDVIARHITRQANKQITENSQRYHVKNTQTRLGNVEMEKTLTYYAIQNGKSAFGIEASKAFNTEYRAYFHLNMIESFMQFLGIGYERPFNLAVNNVRERIDENIKLALYDKRMLLDMRNVRKQLRYVPIKKGSPISYSASNPLIAVLDHEHSFQVRYGNRSLTRLLPQYFLFDSSLNEITMTIDGRQQNVPLGEIVNVHSTFMVQSPDEYRVNIIGYMHPGSGSEDGVVVSRKQIRDEYSVDEEAKLYRVEFYLGSKFCGMILVNFTDHPLASIQHSIIATPQEPM